MYELFRLNSAMYIIAHSVCKTEYLPDVRVYSRLVMSLNRNHAHLRSIQVVGQSSTKPNPFVRDAFSTNTPHSDQATKCSSP